MVEPAVLPRNLAYFGSIDTAKLNKHLKKLHDADTFPPVMIAQSQSHASALTENICSDYKLLNDTMIRHEPLIRKRWSKKSVAQRSEILRAAYPTIAMEHQPDFAWRYQNMLFEEGAGPKPKEHVDVMLWPFINLEDLTKPKSLLIYLNSRARNLPWTFATGEYMAKFGEFMAAVVKSTET
ncbi:uncharacterized protein J4E79_008493 [Alternaria viburni]|uniref:uncharacterized protein n=1 Tax=Alternaria viburni TaxID=566460 RepID=UPI0020C3AB23|nr:uncharacterized protein J4E79_008493 [Alternaria viburni]KAI4654619.1 hypothetical protein J4E79_008493 [Alternaria viburni]